MISPFIFKGFCFHRSKFLCKDQNAAPKWYCYSSWILMLSTLECISVRYMACFWPKLLGIVWAKRLLKSSDKKWSYLKFVSNSWKNLNLIFISLLFNPHEVKPSLHCHYHSTGHRVTNGKKYTVLTERADPKESCFFHARNPLSSLEFSEKSGLSIASALHSLLKNSVINVLKKKKKIERNTCKIYLPSLILSLCLILT